METIENFQHYTKPFMRVTVNTFKNFVGFDLIPKNPYMLNREQDFEYDISGVIGLSGAIKGAVILSMNKDVATKLTGRLTGAEHTEIDHDVADALGEIVNIISGNIKKDVREGDDIRISLPTIIRGSEHYLSWPSKRVRTLCIPLDIFENDTIYLLVAFEPESQEQTGG
jgi:chemotaxis protein CheX